MTLLLHNGGLIDGRRNQRFEQAWVLIEDGVIKTVHEGKPSDTVPGIRLDMKGGTVLPGLINLHTHIQRRHLHRTHQTGGVTFRQGAPLIEAMPDAQRMAWAIRNAWDELREGTTTMRDTGSKHHLSTQLREVFRSGVLKGPRIVTCGEGIAITGGHGSHGTGGVVEADGLDNVRRATREQMKAGADWIKLMSSAGLGGMPDREDVRFVELDEDEMRVAVREAHKRGRRVCAHADATEAVKNCVRAGVDCIEHGTRADDEGIRMMAERGSYFVPTLTGSYNLMILERESGNLDVSTALENLAIEPHERAVRRAIEDRVKIGVGTDTLGEMVQEIEMLRDFGMSPMASIQAATSVAAEILGLESQLGSIEPGKRADLLVVQGDPLRQLGLLRQVVHVLKDGHLVSDGWLNGHDSPG
jgi:imidazolonepropionase-like amidohydrolase